MKKIESLKGGMGLRFVYLVFWWFLFAHWTACLWWYIGKHGFKQESERWFRGEPPANETTWVVRVPPVGKLSTGFSAVAFEQCVNDCLTNRSYSRVQCMASHTCDDNK